jgi:tripartite-type tricarboxylate transporter receptor subunit TctC
VNNNPVDIATMTVFGIIGYLMHKFGFPLAPMVLAFVLGPIMETALRQSLIMSRGSFLIFWETPVAGTLMSFLVLIAAMPIARALFSFWKRHASRRNTRASVVVPAVLLLVLPPIVARAQDYPAKPVSLVVPYPAGGRTDLTGRAVAQYLKGELGQPVVVINKPGAGGVLGAKEVASASPDGYTLGIFSTGFLTAQYTVPTPTSAAEYEMVALVNEDPAVVAVPAAMDWKSLTDLLQYGRANPGKLRVGIDPGSSAQIFAAAFVDKAVLEVLYVPFRGGGERTVALAGGHIHVDFDILAPLKTMREAGKVRVLAVASTQRVPEYSEIPTMAEQGIDLAISSWHGVFAPRGTPAPAIARISSALRRVADNPDFRERMRNLQLGVKYLDTAQFREFFAESDRINLALIRKLGLLVAPSPLFKQHERER